MQRHDRQIHGPRAGVSVCGQRCSKPGLARREHRRERPSTRRCSRSGPYYCVCARNTGDPDASVGEHRHPRGVKNRGLTTGAPLPGGACARSIGSSRARADTTPAARPTAASVKPDKARLAVVRERQSLSDGQLDRDGAVTVGLDGTIVGVASLRGNTIASVAFRLRPVAALGPGFRPSPGPAPATPGLS